MPTPVFPHLLELLEEGSQGLPGVSKRRMFGCDALFADGTVYGLVWKTGRIGLKLPEPAAFDELMAMPGSEPWMAGTKTISGWVLVPETFHDDPSQLRTWVERAHRLATGTPAKKPAATKPAATKPAAKKPAAKAKRPARVSARKARR